MYAVLRVAKLKTMGEIGQLGKHNERTRETRNADDARRGDNVRLAGTGDWCADAQARLDDAPTLRSNAVLAMEHVLTASREFYHQGDERARAARLDDWTARSMAWLRDTYGERNVVAAVLHKDEQTPHIQALVVPIDERGRLNAHAYTGGRALLARMQDSYAAAVRDLGLERGVKGSVADHQTVREFYAKIMEPTPAPEIVRRDLEVERPGRLVGNPERWASEQTERIAERIAPALDAALVKATHYEGQAAKAEANVVVLQQRVRDLERDNATVTLDYKALVAQVRGIALDDTMRALGGEQDRHDKHKWQVAGEHISINGEKFYNHDRQSGGGQSIDLVMHVGGYTFRQAVAYLNHAGGPELAVAAAAQYGARQGQEIVERERGEPARFMPPARDEGRWPQVRTYLTEERGIPRGLVDELHARGTLYADRRANAVFIRQDAEGQAVGASLRGTAPGSQFQGLALGSRRGEGHFSFSLGEPAPYRVPQYHIAESPIDALSRAALAQHVGERGEFTFVSNDGHGELPRRQIEEGLARGALVHCGFDNDTGGDKLWQQVTEAYPRAEAVVRERPPADAKDWNEALQAQWERQATPDRAPGPEQSRGRDSRADERR